MAILTSGITKQGTLINGQIYITNNKLFQQSKGVENGCCENEHSFRGWQSMENDNNNY